MPRLPQRVAILERRRPLEALGAVFARNLLDGADLIFDGDLAGAVELEEQRRRERIVGLRVGVDDAAAALRR